MPRTILENYFGRQFPTQESKFLMQLGCMRRRSDTSGRIQMDNPGMVHQQSTGNHNILSVFMALIIEISGLLQLFIIIFKGLKLFFNTYVYKSLIWAPKLKLIKGCPHYSRTVPGCESFLESKCSKILVLFGANLDDSIDSTNFLVRIYLPLIRNDSVVHMHDLAVYVKEGPLIAWGLSLENSKDSHLCFRLTSLHLVSFYFFFYQSSSSFLWTTFDAVFYKRYEVLSIKSSADACLWRLKRPSLGLFNLFL